MNILNQNLSIDSTAESVGRWGTGLSLCVGMVHRTRPVQGDLLAQAQLCCGLERGCARCSSECAWAGNAVSLGFAGQGMGRAPCARLIGGSSFGRGSALYKAVANSFVCGHSQFKSFGPSRR